MKNHFNGFFFYITSYVLIKWKIQQIQHSKLAHFIPSKNKENHCAWGKHVKVWIIFLCYVQRLSLSFLVLITLKAYYVRILRKHFCRFCRNIWGDMCWPHHNTWFHFCVGGCAFFSLDTSVLFSIATSLRIACYAISFFY